MRNDGTEILDASDGSPFLGGPSFPLKNRVKRVVWNIAWTVLASWTPPAFKAWRRAILRIFGARVANTAIIYSSARIWLPSNLEICDLACVGPNVTVYNMAMIKIGARAIISQGSYLCCGTHDVNNAAFQLLAKPIEIGEKVWIAAEAFVGPGVKVGDGAVLGARAVAMRSVNPWTIYSGNPAVAIRGRSEF
ncbi:2,3,4,5-tetrahydropyridine-2,6-dicarboxylate N-acetyltransferase (plasmid) [Asticcacaulis sp. MM231]